MINNLLKEIDNILFFKFFYKIYRKVLNRKTIKLYSTKTGKYYLPKYAFKDIIRNEIIKGNIFDQEIYDLSKSLIKENSIVIDAGANYGQMSILFSKVKEKVLVYSFESSKYIYKILEKNIKINQSYCKAINCILGNESGSYYNIKKLNLENFNTYGSNKIEIIDDISNENEFERVKTFKIDDINFEKQISFFKIDVQGYVLEVLKGAKETIYNHKMPIIFEYEKLFEKDFNYNFNEFEKFIKRIDYKIHKEIDHNYLIIPK